MPKILLPIVGLAMVTAATLAASRTDASVSITAESLRAALGGTSIAEPAAVKCANRRVCRPGQGCAWRKVCKRW
jgi:hypothetical protein